ncbi:MAG: acyltransferase domain-containing protein [Rhodospirillum sp.]|nr:acyltransferase domain-containing protein [Rhodospirillum sp.]MCF8488352.1 acyltransferase domain-containing protein [Rhodospirillum sp.]
MTHDQAIAIVGMAVNVPRARTLEQLWHNLSEGVCCIDRFEGDPADAGELDRLLLRHGERIFAGGVIEDPSLFDAEYFNYSNFDAELIDPQQRVMLELAKDAIENASLPEAYFKNTGVFAGCAASSYLHTCILPRQDVVAGIGAFGLTMANDKDFLATRISYKLGLGGPSLSVQTACSTSLVAVHVAVQSLLAGDCDTAIAGGVSIRIPQRRGYLYQVDGVMSPDGLCRPFDHRAGGFVPSNGAVAVVLRRLESALADHDPIRGVILASAVKNDGEARPSFAAPGLDGQVATLSEALAMSALGPEDISLIETHGTATKLGDQIEFEALRRVYGGASTPCHIGAAKSCLGHLDTASGALGLVKTVLSLEKGVIPPVLHFDAPNPDLHIENTRFQVPTKPVAWPRAEVPRHAAVTSLGLGGTNAHVILTEAPIRERRLDADRPRVFLISAKTEKALGERRRAVGEALLDTSPEDLADLSYALATGAARHPVRDALCIDPTRRDDAKSRRGLAAATRGTALEAPKVAFLFPGGGAHFPGMIEGLCEAEPLFARDLALAIDLVQPLTTVDLRAAIFEVNADSEMALRRPSVGLPSMFCVQLAMARTLMGLGVKPAALIGHSAGEYVAATLAGIIAPDAAAALVVLRANRFEETVAGTMLSVDLGVEDVIRRLPEGSSLEISVINGPENTVVGGSVADISAFIGPLTKDGVEFSEVAIDVAAHTSLVAPIAEELVSLAKTMRFSPPTIPCISNVSGDWMTPEDQNAEYWGKHLRQCVRFGDGLATLTASGATLLVDIGPGTAMTGLAARNPALRDDLAKVAMLPRHRGSQKASVTFMEGLGALWCHGAAIDWPSLFDGEQLSRVAIPPHPLRRQSHWITPPSDRPVVSRRAAKDVLFTPTLEAIDLGEAVQTTARWLIRCDDPDFADRLSGTLRLEGIAVVIEAGPGERDWAAILARRTRDAPLDGIMVVWASTAPPDTPGAPFHDITNLARAVGYATGEPVGRILVASRAAGPAGASYTSTPPFAMAAAATRVIHNEYPDLTCQSLEIHKDETSPSAAEAILALVRRPAPHNLYFRDGRFHQEAYRPMTPPARPSSLAPKTSVWIITGGLGAIGRTLAVHLAKTTQARLVLVGRTDPPSLGDRRGMRGEPRLRADALQAIVDAGGAWTFVSGDIADPAVARTAVETARDVYGEIHGIIHAAGVPAGGLIQLRGREDSDAVLRPKIQGLNSLLAALPSPIPIMILCSALDSLLGTTGQGEHCAANAYLDAVACLGPPNVDRTVAINWSAWRDIGQAATADVPEQFRSWRARSLADALTAQEGCEIFDAVLTGNLSRVVVSVSDITALKALARNALVGGPRATDPDVPKNAAGPSLQSATEIRIAELWHGLLNANNLEADDDFFGLGGHSLAAMQLVSRLREAFSVPVRLQELIRRTTIPTQAEYVDLLLIQQIEDMSDEEVSSALGS